ncbi:MAG TPA: molybdate ABC transporter substrate-binding protein [Candidatus Acidoferrales bacterium]|jgi:molybdate transport system substrate-binding protein|nr:molybdate ABC transporter substrate-binding protein [Candidatus Acidoferrales bacterium]
MSRRIRPGLLAVCVLLCSAAPPRASAQEITIAAASDLQFVFPQVAARFEKETGHPVRLTYGSSGNFFSQIQNGAPFDLFFSADIDFPKKLEAAGLTEPGTLYQYATGKIVLWVRNDSTIDLSRGLQLLSDPAVRKIAIANPEHAPYGRAAVAAFQHERLYDQVRSKFVLGENITQTAQFVASGNADIGILALSLAVAQPLKSDGRYVQIPASFYPHIDQGAVILKSSPHKDIGEQFIAFLKTPEIVSLMRDFGFIVPDRP